MDNSTIILLCILVAMLILPFIIAKSRGEKYVEAYIIFLKNNGINLSAEDGNLIHFLVKERYKNNLWLTLFAFSLLLVFHRNLNNIVFIIITLILVFNFITSFTKFQRSCPYCHSKVKLTASRCNKCTKQIGSYWGGEPILEQFHKR